MSGVIDIGSPQLNLSGVIAKLAGAPFDLSNLNRNICEVDLNSSLALSGKGGLPSRAGETPLVAE